MIQHSRRVQLADELLRRFASALRAAQLYSPTHPLVAQNVSAFAEGLSFMFGQHTSVTLGVVGGEFVVADVPLPKTSAGLGDLLRRLQRGGVERITLAKEVTRDEIAGLVQALAVIDATIAATRPEAELPTWRHITVGRIQVQQRADSVVADAAAVRQLYADATKLAQDLWDTTTAEGHPDPAQARTVVDSLAHAAAQNRTALLALTALKQYDNYTFTHMVNVSILTMAQARAVGIDGAVLREFGLAGLMHDIGKVRTPSEILNKPSTLTDAEFEIMKRHVVDGAEILRATPDIPPVVPIVAFEHHLRLDGTGYPVGVKRETLNLATQLCGIADVYDAMRSQRKYQEAFPTDRILAVLQRNDGKQFDQRLVRRFVQIIGIYPVGNLVRLDTGETGVVVRINPADPHRPTVRVLIAADGRRLGKPYDVSLWEAEPGAGWPATVTAPVDPAVAGIEPLTLL
jgi:putative nucleotidyltransferase with HDIG domain